MKSLALLLIAFVFITQAQARDTYSFYCSGALQSKWTTYYCVNATFKNSSEIFDISVGLCEGSRDAVEEEPIEVVEIKSAKHNPKLMASSSAWKNASAFDLTTDELGKAVLYIKQETFKRTTQKNVLRLKITPKDGKELDLRLGCGGIF